MSFNRLYSEILEEFEQAPSRKEKIEVLKKYDHPRLREFFFYLFSDNIKFDVQIPKYKPNPEPAGLTMSTLHLEMPRLYRFIENHPKRPSGLYGEKQMNLLINVLESLHKDEAELLINLIIKKIKIPFLTAQIVKESYPGINL